MEEKHSSVESLVCRVQSGEPSALGHLVRKLERPLLVLASRILHDPVEAEDVVVEVLARLIPRVHEFDSPARFAAYARSAVRNQSVDTLRSRSFRDARRALRDTDSLSRQRPDDASDPIEQVSGGAVDAEGAIVLAERRRLVREAVEGLGEPRRTVISMFYEEDRSYAEIAEALEVSAATVKRHLGAARLVLAARLRDLEREDNVA